MEKTAESQAYEFLKAYHNDDQALVESWCSSCDKRWIMTVRVFQSMRKEAAEIARLQEAKRRALAVADERNKENVALRAEAARLRARPTEAEVAQAMCCPTGCMPRGDAQGRGPACRANVYLERAHAILALFPKVQP